MRGDMFQQVVVGGSRNAPTRGPLAIDDVWELALSLKWHIVGRETPNGSCIFLCVSVVCVSDGPIAESGDQDAVSLIGTIQY